MGGIDGYTKLLLHFNGTDGSTTFTDEMGHSFSGAGNAQLDTSRKVFGTASLKLDGAGDWISSPDSADWAFGLGDFTIDFWLTLASITAEYYALGFFRQYVAAVSQVFFGFVPPPNGGQLVFWASTGSPATYQARYSVAWAPQILTPYHLALVRQGTNIFFFIMGVRQTLTITNPVGSNSLPDPTAALDIGRYNDSGGSGSFSGWIDEFRVSKGIARWTSDFTPPGVEYSNPVAFTKNFSESMGVADSFGRGSARRFVESISASDRLKKASARQVRDSLSMNETIRRQAGRRFFEGITIGEDYGRRLSLKRTVQDQVNLTEVGAKNVEVTLEDSVTTADAAGKGVGRTFTERISVKEAFVSAFRWLKDLLNPKTWSKSTRQASTWQKSARDNSTWEK